MSPPGMLGVWREIARELEADLDYADDRDDRGRREEIVLRMGFRNWPLELVCSRRKPPGDGKWEAFTRMSAPVRNPEGFLFNLYQERFRHRLLKIVGLQDIVVGDEELDKRYIVQANDEAKIRALLARPDVRRAFESHHIEQLELGEAGDVSGEADTGHLLRSLAERRLTTRRAIEDHLRLFRHALDGMLALGCIEG